MGVPVARSNGRTVSYTYDNDLLSTLEDHAGRVFSFTYDGQGRMTSITAPDPDGGATPISVSMTYDPQTSLLTSVTDPLGRTTNLSYGADLRVTSISRPGGISEQFDAYLTKGLNTLVLLDEAAGTHTDPLGHQTKIVTDPFGNVTAQTDAFGNTTFFERDANGRVTKIIAPEVNGQPGAETAYAWDQHGRMTEMTLADGSTRAWTYATGPHLNEPLSYTDELGQTWTYTYDSNGNRLTETDPLGNTTSHTYDSQGRLTSMTLPDPDGTGPLDAPVYLYSYDDVACGCGNGGSGRLSEVVLPDGSTLSYTYDVAGNLLTSTDEFGSVTTHTYDLYGRMLTKTLPDPDGPGPLAAPVYAWTYDVMGRLLTETDPLGNTTTYTWDVADRLASVTDALGNTTSFAWDAAGQLIAQTDPLDNVTAHEYDAAGQLIKRTLPDPDGTGPLAAPVYAWTYDVMGRLLTETDPLGNTTSYDYDLRGRLVAVTDPLGGVTAYTYDAAGNLLTLTDPLGNVTSYTYDARNRLVETTLPDPDGPGPLAAPVYLFTYDAAGQLVGETDALGNVTSYAYDNLGRLIEVTLPDPGATGVSPVFSFTYDLAGNLLTETDLLGNVTTYEYDAHGKLIKVIGADPDGAGPLSSPITTYTYDAIGRLLNVTDPLGRVSTFEYDAHNRLVKQTDPDPDGAGPQLPAVTTFAYDLAGNLNSRTDPLGKTTNFAYDNLYRRISTTDPLSGVTSFSYDAVGNLLSLTDPVGNSTSWIYDALNRPLQETNELNDSRYFEFDAVGNLVKRTDRNGRVREFTFDNLYRMTEERWHENSSIVHTLFYQFDVADRLTGASDTQAAYRLAYDNLHRRTQVTHDLVGVTAMPVVVTNSAYDKAGRRTTLSAQIRGVDDFVTAYGYDNLHRMTGIQQHGVTGGNAVADKRIGFTYDAAGQWQSIKRYQDLTATTLVAQTNYTFDNAGRLLDLTHSQPGVAGTLAGYNWTFDVAGRVTEFTSVIDGIATYSYDDTDQLIGADYDYQTDEAYSFDANGNRTNTGYTTGANNRLLSDGTYNYEYDAEGNRTKKIDIATGAATSYAWDHRNRLVMVIESDSSATILKTVRYGYDAFDQRIWKLVSDASGTRTESYIYDGLRPERDNAGDHLLLRFDDAGDLTNRYVHGPAIDQILADEQIDPATGDSNTLWPLTDNLGTGRDIADHDDTSGVTAIVNHITFDSFGNRVAETNAAVDHLFGYTGRDWDEDVDLQYNRARWYDPAVRRWMSEDPIGFAAGDANLNRYVGNGPTNATDPNGMKLSLESLESLLSGIAASHEARLEARRIAFAINRTWDNNWKWNWSYFSIHNQKARGYYCYEWAYAFADALKLESSGKFFKVTVEAYGDEESGKVHSFITITSLETGRSIYVDDGFLGSGYVHRSKPINNFYKTPFDLTDELARDKCNIPRPYRGEPQYQPDGRWVDNSGWGQPQYIPYHDDIRYIGGAF